MANKVEEINGGDINAQMWWILKQLWRINNKVTSMLFQVIVGLVVRCPC